MSHRLWIVLALFVLGACGGSKKLEEEDAGVVEEDAGTSCPTSDTVPPFIASATPADHARLVNPDDDIVLRFSSALDPATISALTVRIVSNGVDILGRTGVLAERRWDAARCTLTIDPTRPLPYASDVTVSHEGLLAVGGLAVAPTTLSFRTHEHAPIRVTTREGSGYIKKVEWSVLDADRLRVETYLSATAGVDGQWGSADDYIAGKDVYTYTPDRLLVRHTAMIPGFDMVFGTSDDDVYYYQDFTASAMRAEAVSRDSRGPDALWFTSDDGIGSLRVRELDASGALRLEVLWRSPGPDMMFRTYDDQTDGYGRYDVDADGFRTRVRWYKDAGVDDIFVTADDPPATCHVLEHDALGRPTRTVRATPGGTACFTPGDVPTDYDIVEYVGNEARVRTARVGADGMVDTADDELVELARRTYDDAGHVLAIVRYAVGPDALPFTSDDLPISRVVHLYAPNGLHASEIVYEEGADGMYLTSDDVELLRTDYDVGP